MQIEVKFPKKLLTNDKGLIFLGYFWGGMKKIKNSIITWYLPRNFKFDTNLLAFIGFVIKRLEHRNNVVVIREHNRDKTVEDILSSHCEILFNIYNKDSNIVPLTYKQFDIVKEEDLLERFFKDELQNVNVLNKKIITIISELVTNIKMHASPKVVSICGYHEIKNNLLKISIFNMGITVKQNIERNSNYKFLDDTKALEWAIKKSNSTRHENDTGGLGLYLARKFLAEMSGKFEIASGKALIIENPNMDTYDLDRIQVTKAIPLKSFIPGTIISITINLDHKEVKIENEFSDNTFIEFEKILEELEIEYQMHNKIFK